jgi:EmrB/QacA subfamily drug resistance transporter
MRPMTSKRWVLLAAVLGSAVVFLDSTVVNVALPRIGRELPRSFVAVLEGQSYIYYGYLLTLSALLVLAGALNDFFGRRRMFILGLLGFLVTSVLCGLAPTMELLVAFRILQGTAGALLVPGSLSLLAANFGGEEQGRAYGIWSAGSAATTTLGPFVGGFLVDSLTWRAAFFINVPVIAIALYAMRHVPESRDDEATGQFDWAGAATVALAVGGLSFGAIYGGQRNWQDPLAFVALGIGAVATIIFPFLMQRRRHPLVPLGLFKSRNFSVTNISTFLIYGALYVTGQFQGLFMQGTLGYTAAAAGFAFIPAGVLLALFSSRFGALAGRHGPRWFMSLGPVVMAMGLAWFARVPSSSVAWALVPSQAASFVPPMSYLVDFLPGTLLFGIGLVITVAPLTTALMTSVPVHNSGLGSAINNAISRVGPQLLGAATFVALTGTFYGAMAARITTVDFNSAQVRAQVSPLNRPTDGVTARNGTLATAAVVDAARAASTQSFHLAMEVGVVLVLLGSLVNAAGIRNLPPMDEGS